MPSIVLEQEVIAAAITTALVILYLLASDVHQHSTYSTEAEQRLCSEALPSEVGLLQNFRAYKWIPLSVE